LAFGGGGGFFPGPGLQGKEFEAHVLREDLGKEPFPPS
jgi:hypothetical protein